MLRRWADVGVLAFVLALPLRAQDLASAAGPASSAECAPLGLDRDELLALKREKFVIADDVRRNAFAIALAGCLGDADPEIRDGVAYEALTAYMRGKQLTEQTLVALRVRLLDDLRGPEGDGFIRPFAALVLSEVARTDWVEPYLLPADRAQLVTAATEYLRGITDYRGFDERDGWRHGVAHAADLLMQLAFNPQVTHDQRLMILDAVEAQLLPSGQRYLAGEPERLAGPVLAVARREALTEAEWTSWLARVIAPAQRSQPDSAERHNASAFLARLREVASSAPASPLALLVPGVESAQRGLRTSN
ncbi:MAG: DUF2785 domain-containing protein [Gemmatimonadaceae bacterium]|nr:DUF2785 domain-containing protein [Gemmatimonadaceae bacterium]MCW5827306.1 DUF2785 domain-containing protein [Gemmatimonadaceae bacterium]